MPKFKNIFLNLNLNFKQLADFEESYIEIENLQLRFEFRQKMPDHRRFV